MAATAVLAVLIAVSDAGSPELAAAVAAASEVIGSGGAVRVVEVRELSDAEARRVEGTLPAPAAVQLGWRDPERLVARLRLHAARTDRWIERELTFLTADSPAERGRALGFAMASMLPEGDPELQVTAARAPPAPAAAEPLGRRAVELAFLAGAGLGGPASGLGGTLRGEVFVTERASLGLSVSARVGGVASIDAADLTTSLGLGGAWWALAPSADRHLGLALRGEALLLYHAVSHESAGGTTRWQGRALPGGALHLEGTWRIATSVELLADVGTEVAFGTIDVAVIAPAAGAGAATIPALRAIGAAGLRVRF